jgi:hypothetical protein
MNSRLRRNEKSTEDLLCELVRLLLEKLHLIDSESQPPELGGSKELSKFRLFNLRKVVTCILQLRHRKEVRAPIGYCPPAVLNVLLSRAKVIVGQNATPL